MLARSLDRGATWQESVVDDGIVPAARFIPFLPPFPSLAVVADGTVHAAFHDARLGSPDVWVWSLPSDTGRWRDAVRVNDTARDDRTAQYLPAVAVAPGGRVDVVYYDRRADRENVLNRVSLQSSHDGARTFGPSLRLSGESFDSRIGFGSERGLADLGSRLGVVAGDDRALVVWSDTRAGSDASSKQDLMRAAVAPMQDGVAPGLADDLGRLGLALMVGGFATVAIVARRAHAR